MCINQEKIAVLTAFYLNYEGCKAGRYGLYSSHMGQFYLNYEGCKVSEVSSIRATL